LIGFEKWGLEMMVDSEYGGGPWNDEKMVLNLMNQEFEEGEIVEVEASVEEASVEEETVEVKAFAVDLKRLVMIARRLIVGN
jgi:hypothetical protein